MAIQPIDLSTMYSQMDKVAKYNASQTQNAQIASQISNDMKAQAELQKSQAVQEAAKNQPDSGKIQEGEGGGSSAYSGGGKRKKPQEEENPPAKKLIKLSDPDLGHIIDITR